MIKTGVHQQAIELFEAAKIWWKKLLLYRLSENSSHSVDIPAWFALAADSKTQVWVEGNGFLYLMPCNNRNGMNTGNQR